jgi:hypothetical protein
MLAASTLVQVFPQQNQKLIVVVGAGRWLPLPTVIGWGDRGYVSVPLEPPLADTIGDERASQSSGDISAWLVCPVFFRTARMI